MRVLIYKLTNLNLGRFCRNLLYLFRYEIKKEFANNNALLLNEYRYKLQLLKDEILYYKIIDYFNKHPQVEYTDEIDYIKSIGKLVMFPYAIIKQLSPVNYGFDNERHLPYVLHGTTKRLYFPKSWSVQQAVATYSTYIQSENLLGGSYTVKAPHQYQSATVRVREGDLLIDIGAAEALFCLEHIDIVRKAIIIESDPIWIEALTATFEPYKHKVSLVHKRIATDDTSDAVTLSKCLMYEDLHHMFVKMDIEGYETVLIKNNEDLLRKCTDVKIVCCTYHKATDAIELDNNFRQYGYKTEFSNGYMIFYLDEYIAPPYFRKGLIRAMK